AAEPYIGIYTIAQLAFVGVLIFIVLLYVCGLLVVAWGQPSGCCNYRSGRWCFSLGACCFVLLFAFVALSSTVGLLGAIMATRVGCTLADHPGQPVLIEPIRFLQSVVRHHVDYDTIKWATEAVSPEYAVRVLARFDECEETKLSTYRLMGEPFVRNLSEVIGYQKQLAFLWEGFNMSEIDEKLGGITAAIGISGADASKLKELGEKLSPLLNFSLDIPKPPYEPDLSTQGQDLTAAIAEVDDIIKRFQQCTKAKVFKNYAIESLFGNSSADDPLKKAAKILEERRRSMSTVVKNYADFVIYNIKENLVKCPPAYAMYKSTVVVACSGIAYPFINLFAAGKFLVLRGHIPGHSAFPAMFMALFMSTLYSRKPKPKPVIEQRPLIADTLVASKRTFNASIVRTVETKNAAKKEPPPSSSSSSCSCVYTDTPTPEPEIRDAGYRDRLLEDDNFDIYIRVKPRRNEDEAEDSSVQRAGKRETEVSDDEEIIISYDGGSRTVAKANVKGDKKETKNDKAPGTQEKKESKASGDKGEEDKGDLKKGSSGVGKKGKDAKASSQKKKGKAVAGKGRSDVLGKKGNDKETAAEKEQKGNDKRGDGKDAPKSKRDEKAKDEGKSGRRRAEEARSFPVGKNPPPKCEHSSTSLHRVHSQELSAPCLRGDFRVAWDPVSSTASPAVA
ncbi:hypothetical protein MTO96_027639, partial [Rhipicephalus appendiculatus]